MPRPAVASCIRLIVFAILLVAIDARAAQQLPGVPTLAPLISQVSPAVVNISIKSRSAAEDNPLLRDPFFRRFFNIPDRPPQEMASGSGVIVDARQGIVLTNNHVIKNAAQVLVTLKDRRQFPAQIVGTDPATDVAVLRIEGQNLTALKLGDSDQMSVGDFVVAIGNPFGLGQTVTSGIVSALGRSGLSIEGYEDFIQTDASINPGNSGGALINLKGELIGINTAIIGPSGANVGIGFAVPSNMARAVMNQLVRFGEVKRGRLGIDFEDLSPDAASKLRLPSADGVTITNVQAESAAEKAGLRRGDVVLTFNGRTIRNNADLRNRLGLTPVGEEAELTILRGGQQLTVKVRIAPPQATTALDGEVVPQLAGLKIANIDRNRIQTRVEGVIVVGIEAGSTAAGIGLRPGDIIAAINRQRVRNINEFLTAMRGVDRAFQMSVVRGDFVLNFIVR